MGSDAEAAPVAGLWIRRSIAVAGALLALAVAFVVYSGLGANTRAASPSFFDNAVSVPSVYRKALGPTSLLTELRIQRTSVAADILVGAAEAQEFVLDREVGYVVARTRFDLQQPSPGEIAFALATVDFAALPGIVDEARPQLGLGADELPSRVVVTRPRGDTKLRWRVHRSDEQFVDVTRNVR